MLARHYASVLFSRFAVRHYVTRQRQPAAKGKASAKPAPKSKAAETTPTDASGTTATADRNKPLSGDELVEKVEMIRAMSRLHPTLDPWGQRVETLDVILPYPVSFATQSHFPSARAMFDQFLTNRLNDGKNAACLWSLASTNAIPGFDLSRATLFQKLVTTWPWRVFTTKSTKTGSWLEPVRRLALSTYKDLNAAVAQQDDKRIKRLTASNYQDDILRTLRKNQNHAHTCIWRFHREISPTKVLSIRGIEGHLGEEAPKFGNRMMVHALVKFDTEQSLEMYNKRGKALHKPADGELYLGQGIVPAEKRRVTEYLVLEKRMWYDTPWVIREQMYESRPIQ